MWPATESTAATVAVATAVGSNHSAPTTTAAVMMDESTDHAPITSSSLLPRSPPYFSAFTPNLLFLGPSIVQQYHQFFHLWQAFQEAHDLPVEGHDTKRIGRTAEATSVVINAFELFRAVVNRGGYYRLFTLIPVLQEIPPLNESTGLPLYALGPMELAYEYGHPWSPDEPAGQLPKSTKEFDWSTKVYLLRDGRFLRNQQIHRSCKLYYERYLLRFEEEYCWKTKDAKKPIYLPTAPAGTCKYDFSGCDLEFKELPPQYQAKEEDLKRMYQHYAATPYKTIQQALEQPKVKKPKKHPRKTASLHRAGVFALMRTLESCFLSNPIKIQPPLVIELIHSINHLLALSKLYASKCSSNSDRESIDQQLHTLYTAALQAGSSSSVPLTTLLLESAPPSWYFDVLLLFEFDIITHLLDQLIHPFSLQQRIETLLTIDQSQFDGAPPQLPGLPSAFSAEPGFNALPARGHKYLIQQLLHHLTDIAYPNLTRSILTFLQNLTYPGSVTQRLIETQLETAAKQKRHASTTVIPDKTPLILVATVRANLLQHPWLLSMLLDFIDMDSKSHAMDLAVDATDDSLPDRFDIIDVPPKDIQAELKAYLAKHSSLPVSSTNSSATILTSTNSIIPITNSSSPLASSSIPMNTIVKMEVDENKDELMEEKSSSLEPSLLSSSSESSSPTSTVHFIPLSRSLPFTECRYLALEIITNLTPDIPWLTATHLLDSTVNFSDNTSTNIESSPILPHPRAHIYWREVTRELESYDQHLIQQLLRSPQTLTPPSVTSLEFLMNIFQVLIDLVQAPNSRTVLETLLPHSDDLSSAGRVVNAGCDFYSTLLSIATLDLERYQRPAMSSQEEKQQANHGATPTVTTPQSRPLHWSERLQLCSLELLMQFFIHSSICASFFLRHKSILTQLVHRLKSTTSVRLKRTVAAVIAAILAYVHRWEKAMRGPYRERRHIDPAVLAQEPPSTVFTLLHPHQASIFEVCASDADVTLLLAKWLELVGKNTKREANKAEQRQALAKNQQQQQQLPPQPQPPSALNESSSTKKELIHIEPDSSEGESKMNMDE